MASGFPDPRNITAVTKRNTDKGFLLRDQEKWLQTMGPYQFVRKESQSPTGSPPKSNVFKTEDRVNIEDLAKSLNTRLQGKYFLCRLLAPFFEMYSIMSIVEDPEGEKGMRIGIYNHSKIEFCPNGMTVGKIMVIKNPLFKRTMDGDMCLRSDEPKDVVLISQADFPIWFPGVEWKGKLENSLPSRQSESSKRTDGLPEHFSNLKLTPLAEGLRKVLDPKKSCWEACGIPEPQWSLEQKEFKKLYGTDSSDSD